MSIYFIRKCGVVLGWLLFLVMLASTLSITTDLNSSGSGPLTTVCIQTENDADSILLVQQGAAILIDAGEEIDAPHILEVLREYGVGQLDYFILTHGDKDHVGGAIQILSEVPARRVIEPYYEAGESVEALNDFLEQENIPITYPTRTLRFRAGTFRVLIYPPLEKHYNDANNYSLAVLIQHDKVNQLFAGDALRKRSEELLQTDWGSVELYKVPHHGRANSATDKLFNAVQPKFAVITAGAADTAILEAAKRNKTQLFYTSDNDCVFISDGNILQVQQKEN